MTNNEVNNSRIESEGKGNVCSRAGYGGNAAYLRDFTGNFRL